MKKEYFSSPILLKDIHVTDKFWHSMMENIRVHMIPYQWDALNDRIEGAEPSYCMQNYKVAAQMTNPSIDYGLDNSIGFNGNVFQDSDFAKWIEAVGYSLIWHPDAELEKIADGAIDLVCSVQQDDGYMNTYFIINGLDKRFTNLKDHHEMYCLGHLIEGAIAYYQGTGKNKLLDAVIKNVACIDQNIGLEEGKLPGYPGHEVLEMALVRLYEVTKDENHLRLAKYFIDQRGQEPLFFREETERNQNKDFWKDSYFQYQYYQAGKPVRDQKIAEGHAVRAVYLYAGMADIAKLTNDDKLYEACESLWNNITNKQMYITGSIGQSKYGEAFSYDYDLPNDTVYAETCAAIGLVFFAKRMLEIYPKSIYADIMEKALFNGIISGVSLDGKSFFYVNPLEVVPEASEKDHLRRHVKVQRQKWFGCSCCPPNVARLVASLGSYACTVRDDAMYANLYVGGDVKTTFGGNDVTVHTETNYPWDETVDIQFSMERNAKFKYGVRIPNWCRNYSIEMNGEKGKFEIVDGYAIFDREWTNGDEIKIIFSMPVEVMESNPKVRENIGKIAVMRGPIVYCLEEEDNGNHLHLIRLGDSPDFKMNSESGALGDIVTLSSNGKKINEDGWNENMLYRNSGDMDFSNVALKWIPYYTWANRKPGEMMVWVYK